MGHVYVRFTLMPEMPLELAVKEAKPAVVILSWSSVINKVIGDITVPDLFFKPIFLAQKEYDGHADKGGPVTDGTKQLQRLFELVASIVTPLIVVGQRCDKKDGVDVVVQVHQLVDIPMALPGSSVMYFCFSTVDSVGKMVDTLTEGHVFKEVPAGWPKEWGCNQT